MMMNKPTLVLSAILTIGALQAPAAAAAQCDAGKTTQKGATRAGSTEASRTRVARTRSESDAPKSETKLRFGVTLTASYGEETASKETEGATVAARIRRALKDRVPNNCENDMLASKNGNPATPDAPVVPPIAILVLGDVDYTEQFAEFFWPQRVFMSFMGRGPESTTLADHGALLEAEQDFVNRGYQVEIFDFFQYRESGNSTQVRELYARFLARLGDSQVKAFWFIGHAVDENARIDLGPRMLTPQAVKAARGENETDILILHACYQGGSRAASQWISAFNNAEGEFKGWDHGVTAREVWDWQHPW
jgi:hypothetical protein